VADKTDNFIPKAAWNIEFQHENPETFVKWRKSWRNDLFLDLELCDDDLSDPDIPNKW